MRILHVIGSVAPRFGGPSTVMPELCAALAHRGHEVALFTTDMDGDDDLPVPLQTPVELGGYATTYFPVGHPRDLKVSWPMARQIYRDVRQYDIVHVHSLHLFHSVVAPFVCARWQVPYVLRPHGALDRYHRTHHRFRKAILYTVAERRNLKGAAFIHCTSNQERRSVGDLRLGVRVAVIPLGVGQPAVSVGSAAGVAYKDRASPGPVVLFLGRLSAKKGIDLLIRAFRDVHERYPNCRLVIAGPDEEGLGSGLSRLARSCGVASAVEFLGEVRGQDKWSLLQAADIFVLPSATENFGVAAAEALACGVPVVISDEVALAEQVRRHGGGIVCRRSSDAVAAGILRLLDDETLAARCCLEGRRLAAREFSWDAAARRLEDHYLAAVSGADAAFSIA